MPSRASVFFLGAEIRNDAFDDLPTFVSSRDPARTLHDRLEMHFGTESALLVQTTADVGAMPAGSTVEDVLRYLWDFVADRESIWGSKFVLDAYVDEDVFWRDFFTRVVATDLGRSVGLTTRFGDFDWQRLPGGTMAASVDGDDALFVGSGSSNVAEFIGYPTFTSGELWFDIFIPFEIATNWEFEFQPWRDDVTDTAVRVRLRRIGGNWFFDAQIGDIITDPYTAAEGWYHLHFLLGAPGDPIAVNIWPDGDSEPGDWDNEDVLPEAVTGHRWLIMGGSGKTAWSENGVSWTEITVGSTNWQDVCFGLAFGVPTWMAVGSSIGVFYSRDAETWTQVTTATLPAGTLPGFFTCATDGAGTWVACNLAETTPWRAIGDPATSFWRRQTTSLAHGIWVIRWGGGMFVAVTQFGEIATSPDGGAWTNQTSGFNTSEDWFEDAAYGGGVWCAMGGGGPAADQFKTATSPDGITWTAHTVAALVNYFGNGMGFGNGLFVVVGTDFSNGFVATSSDGATWVLNGQVFTEDLNEVFFVDGLWVAVGDSGAVYTASDPTGTWSPQTSGFSTTQVVTVIGRPGAVSGMPRMTVSNSSDSAHEMLKLDNMKARKTDADPVRLYHALTLDATVVVRRTASFTLGAEVVRREFFLNAEVGTPPSGLLGGFTLGWHEPGGG